MLLPNFAKFGIVTTFVKNRHSHRQRLLKIHRPMPNLAKFRNSTAECREIRQRIFRYCPSSTLG